MKKLEWLYSNKVIPLAFDESLSYLEKICYITAKINELIEIFNGLEAYATIEYVDSEVIKLKALINQKLDKTTFDSTIQELRSFLINLQNRVSLNETDIQNLDAKIDTEINAVEADIIFRINQLKDYIDSQLIDIQVINPINGQIQTLQQVLNSIVDLEKTDALTAGEYDALLLTASAYDAYGLTAYAYDFEGKVLLV